MRRALIYLVVALVVGGAVGTLMARDPGYVLVSYESMSLETSLWFAVLALIVGYFLLRIVSGLLMRLIRSGAGVAAWQQNRRARVAQARTVRGLLLAGEGDWPGARKALATDAEGVDLPLVNYLGAARAANEIGDTADRDALLQKASESTPGATLAVGLTRAELQMAARQYTEAAQTLTNQRAASPNQPRVLRMLAECLEALGDWSALLALAPDLQKRGAIAAEPLRNAMGRWSIAWFETAAGAQNLTAQWNALDKDLRADPAVIAAYVRALEKASAGEEAEATLSKSLKQDWNDELVALYGRLRVDGADRRRATAESWLETRPNDATLLLALGRIALEGHDWSSAREYFEASLKQRRSAEIYGELGRLCLAMGERTRAAELLAQSLDMAGQLPQLPLPQATPDATAARS
ncbi:MAG TPA: heme biosynthesis HemY N-terminal domain-containing protein [Pseudomonadales bacterium]|nr:heme biosynthesis HemY N-terminal domain-containing protein [Pseudomonadales bacterium]